MKLFLLTRREGCPESSLGGYDQFEGFVVCAEDPGKAREMVHQHSGLNTVTQKVEPGRCEEVWLQGHHTSCMVIGRPSGPITEPQIILSDYHPG